MKALPLLFATLVLVVGCQTTETETASDSDKSRTNIHQGMDTSEVIALLGQPNSIETDIRFNRLVMDRWRYEIVVDETQQLQDLDTQMVPVFSPASATGYVEVEEPVSVLVQNTIVQVVDILIFKGKVYAVSSRHQSDFGTPDR
ncbi:MAG: hypothetical protein AB3N63_10610 [Puniceicoccaceae bacterium]